MNRFRDFQIDPLKFHRNVRDYPYLTFATDFIYCIIQKYNLDWVPLEMDKVLGAASNVGASSEGYTPHPMSPCTLPVQKAVSLILDRSRRDYRKIYDRLTESTDKLESFLSHIRKILAQLVTDGSAPFEMLFKLTYVGKLTAVFYELGTKSAADLAPMIITRALRDINSTKPPAEWFDSMHVYAGELVSWYEGDPDYQIDVYMSEEDSDVDSSESVQSSSGGEEEDRSSDKQEDDGNDDKISDKQEQAEKPDCSGEAAGENPKKDSESDQKLNDSSELDRSYLKTDESSSDKEFGRFSDESDRAYDASCSSNNEPESGE